MDDRTPDWRGILGQLEAGGADAETAFAMLGRLITNKLFRHAWDLRDHWDDLRASVFQNLLEASRRDRLPDRNFAFPKFVGTITHNRGVDLREKLRKSPKLLDEPDAIDEIADQHSSFGGTLARLDLERLLTPDEDEVVRLRVLAGKTTTQIGEQTHRSKATVDRLWKSALEKIQRARKEDPPR